MMGAKARRTWWWQGVARNLLGTEVDSASAQLLSQHLREVFIRTDGPVIIDVAAAKDGCDVSFFLGHHHAEG